MFRGPMLSRSTFKRTNLARSALSPASQRSSRGRKLFRARRVRGSSDFEAPRSDTLMICNVQ